MPVGAVMVIVPVVVHVGCCVTEAAGAAGADETAFTVTLVGAEIQPALFLTVTL